LIVDEVFLPGNYHTAAHAAAKAIARAHQPPPSH
jgi:hypothetical protein